MGETLFDLAEVGSVVLWPARLRQMYAERGSGPAGAMCGGCAHLVTVRAGGTWFKCDLSRVTGGAGSDWRKSWPACGAFEEGAGVVVHRSD